MSVTVADINALEISEDQTADKVYKFKPLFDKKEWAKFIIELTQLIKESDEADGEEEQKGSYRLFKTIKKDQAFLFISKQRLQSSISAIAIISSNDGSTKQKQRGKSPESVYNKKEISKQ